MKKNVLKKRSTDYELIATIYQNIFVREWSILKELCHEFSQIRKLQMPGKLRET